MPRPEKGKSAAFDFLKAHANDPDGPCLIWPWSRSRGHAQIGGSLFGGKLKKASRIMCEMVNGPPPTPKHECAHSCGCGHLGCVHPKHLSWKTRAENQQDRRKHGTHGLGVNLRSRGVQYKLTPEKVAEIRAIGPSMSKEAIGRRFGITPAHVAKILDRRAWPVDGSYTPRGFAVNPNTREVRAARAASRHCR